MKNRISKSRVLENKKELFLIRVIVISSSQKYFKQTTLLVVFFHSMRQFSFNLPFLLNIKQPKQKAKARIIIEEEEEKSGKRKKHWKRKKHPHVMLSRKEDKNWNCWISDSKRLFSSKRHPGTSKRAVITQTCLCTWIDLCCSKDESWKGLSKVSFSTDISVCNYILSISTLLADVKGWMSPSDHCCIFLIINSISVTVEKQYVSCYPVCSIYWQVVK